MTSSSNQQPPKRPEGVSVAKAVQPTEELVLHGDLSDLTYAFIGHPRRLVTCPVPDSVYLKLQNYPGGISHFIEDAVASFDGDLKDLVVAAVAFVDARRYGASTDPPRNASARILPSTLEKIQRIHTALADIRGMSRAKVLAGLIQLQLHLHHR
jgi:hypothetical protein